MKNILTLAAVVLGLCASSARAQAGKPAADACGAETAKFCPNIEPGQAGWGRCLRPHMADLSPTCQAFFAAHRRPAPAAAEPAAETAAAESKPADGEAKPAAGKAKAAKAADVCAADAAKFCPGLKERDTKLGPCLKKHMAKLSPACKADTAKREPSPKGRR